MTTKKGFLIKSISYRFFRAKFGLNQVNADREQHLNTATSTFRNRANRSRGIIERDRSPFLAAFGRGLSSQISAGRAIGARISAAMQHSLRSADKNKKCDPAHKPGLERRIWSRSGGRYRSPLIDTIEFPAMIEQPAFAALTKAWVTTVIASALVLLALAITQIWNSAVYFQGLPQAIAIGDGPSPIIDRFD